MSAGVVIIGGGQAACQAAGSLRQMGYEGALTLVGDEPHLPYQRPPLSKDFLQGDSGSEAVQLRPASFFETIRCALRTGVRVLAIDRRRKLLKLASGEALPYERLVLATGARARLLPGLDGTALPVHYLRTVDHANALREALAGTRKLAVLGAGYVGMEVAASAARRGIEVDVFESAPRVMQRSVGAHTSNAVQALHAGQGVRLHLGMSIQGVGASAVGAIAIQTAGAGTFTADALVVGIGADPNIELAAEAGLDCGRAIRVDAACATSDPDIFAIGDCTEQTRSPYGADLRLESVQNAIDQGKTAAAAIAGKPAPAPTVPWFWSDQFGHRIQVAGVPHPGDAVVVRRPEAGGANAVAVSQSVWHLRGDRVAAVETIDGPEEFMVAKLLIRNAKAIDAGRLADPSIPLQAVTVVA